MSKRHLDVALTGFNKSHVHIDVWLSIMAVQKF